MKSLRALQASCALVICGFSWSAFDSAHSTLSREHSVTIEVPQSDLHSGFQRVMDRCAADAANHCTILQSDVSSGQFSSGLIRLRIDPKAVEDLIG
jgi:hypothetical protein